MTSAPWMQARAVERRGQEVRRFLIVGSGSQFQRRLRQVDPSIETVVLCRASVLPFVAGVEENQGVVILKDGTPTDRWVSVAHRIHDEWHVQAVASLSEVDQDKAAAVADALGLPCHSIETGACVNDKQRMRDALARSGVERLPYRQVRSLDELEAFYDEVGPPLILKPTSGRASVGVSVVKSRDELAAALRHTHEARGPRLDPSPPLAERYVDGPEFSVESITHAGIHRVFAVTEKFRDLATKVETGHVVPARIDVVAERALIEHLQAALTALGVRTGITHTEVILGADGPVIVETHLREAGDEILHLVEDVSGVDMADLYLRQVAGEDISRDPVF